MTDSYNNKSPGYHIRTISKGQLGDLSKVREEMEEALDAEEQNCKLMVLMELSDMVGAIEAYLEKHHPGMALADLQKMAHITRRAFQSGRRQ